MRMEFPNVPVDIVESEDFRLDVCAGLRQQQRSIPPKYFYDAQGSALFEQICETAEYYLTRTETAILDQYSVEMMGLIGMGNNPMVGATVAVAVAIEEAMK